MEKVEVLLINYLAVLLLTMSIAIFVRNPERIIKSFSSWFVLFHVVLAFLLYKIILIYHGFFAIYCADILIILVCCIARLRRNEKKQSKIDHLAQSLPSLHKLTIEEFAVFLTTLFKAFNFQSVRQVKIKSDDDGDSFDHFLLARQDGNLVEIRMLHQTKTITEDSVNLIANSFRDSTSQATSWLLATSAKSDKNTKIYISNSGVDMKIFDNKTISELVYAIAPDYKPAESWSKKYFIRTLDSIVNYLNILKSKLDDQPSTLDPDSEHLDAKVLLKDAFEHTSTKDILPSQDLVQGEPTEATQSEPVEPKRKRKRKPVTTNYSQHLVNQGNLDLLPTTTENESHSDNKDHSTTRFQDDRAVESPEELEASISNQTKDTIAPQSIDANEDYSFTQQSEQQLPSHESEEINIDETIHITDQFDNNSLISLDDINLADVLNEGDPLSSLDDFTVEEHTITKSEPTDLNEFAVGLDVDLLDDFPVATQKNSLSDDLLLEPTYSDEQVINGGHISESSLLVDASLDLSDIGAAIPPPPSSKRKPRNSLAKKTSE